MALTSEEQTFFDFAKDALPAWIRDGDEFLFGAAKMFGGVKATIDYLFGQALISTAVGATATTPDWLDQHARDRGTGRRNGEGTPTLRSRLRNTPDALTRAALLANANAILVASGGSADAALLELPRDAAFWGTFDAMTGVGGTFTAPVANIQAFTPDVPFARPPRDGTDQGWDWILTTTGAADPNNDVAAAPITSLSGNAAKYTNAAGSADGDATVVWTAEKRRWSGIVTPVVADGRARFYWGRGYRLKNPRPMMLIMILPFGTSAGTAAAVLEMMRQTKAAGFVARVEVRANP